MLRVTKILEGGINLDRGEEIPRSMVVTNGSKEVIVPISDGAVQELVALFAEELGRKVEPSDPVVVSTRVTTVEKSAKTTPIEPPLQVGRTGMTGSLFEPEPEIDIPGPVLEESGFEPGEEYDDSGTGVSSL